VRRDPAGVAATHSSSKICGLHSSSHVTDRARNSPQQNIAATTHHQYTILLLLPSSPLPLPRLGPPALGAALRRQQPATHGINGLATLTLLSSSSSIACWTVTVLVERGRSEDIAVVFIACRCGRRWWWWWWCRVYPVVLCFGSRPKYDNPSRVNAVADSFGTT
jgi:hypothetical protein